MKPKTRRQELFRLVLPLLLLLGTMPAIAAAADDPLTGINRVVVEVALYNEEKSVDQLGDLTAERVRTDVELRLRQAGIKILSKPEAGVPTVRVTIDAFSSGGIAVYTTQIQIFEIVTITRGAVSHSVSAITWKKGAYGFHGKAAKDWTIARDQVKDATDDLCNDLLKANPKTAAEPK